MRKSTGLRLAVLFGTFFIMLLITSAVGEIIVKLPVGDPRTHTLIISTLQCILAFCLPAFFLARYSSNNWEKWLYLTKAPSPKAVWGVIVVYVLSLPAMEWLIEWNQSIHFPESMSALEETLRNWEEANEAISAMLLDARGFFPVLFGVLVIGVFTGFSEELFFRGALQGILKRSNIGISSSIWIAAIIFSTMHFQFFGFLPRLLMGVFFGYLLVWTKSIWVPVFAHMLNNSMVVIISSLTGNTSQGLIDHNNTSLFLDNSFSIIGSVVFTALFLIVCRDTFFKSKSQWQRSQLPPATGR